MRVGSLFSGVGGIELGLEALGMETVFQVESSAFCRRILARHWPEVPRYDDVRFLEGARLPACDVLAGGFPCQDISKAGKRVGIHGERSGLWSEFARLAGELRPEFVFVENVSALVGRGLGRVLGDLVSLGYGATWDCFRASDVGAPHRRDRIFILAYAERDGLRQQPERNQPDEAESRDDVLGNEGSARLVADADGRRLEVERLSQPPGLEGSRRGFPDGRRPVRELLDSEEPSDADLAGRPQFGRTESSREEWAASELHRRRITESGLGGGADGISARLDFGGWGPGWEDGIPRTAVGVRGRVDRLEALGNAVVPAVAALAWKTLASRLELTDGLLRSEVPGFK